MKLEMTPEDVVREYNLDEFSKHDPFDFGRCVGTEGLTYWAAYAYPEEEHQVHKWRSDDGKKSWVMDFKNLSKSNGLWDMQPGDPLHTKPDLKYVGEISKGEVLAGVLSWLAKHTDEDGNLLPWMPDPEDDKEYEEYLRNEFGDESDEIAGILIGGHGAVAVTGIGALIFGNHIRAMQEQGTARFNSWGSDVSATPES